MKNIKIIFGCFFAMWCLRTTLSLYSHWLNPQPDSFVGDSSEVIVNIIFTATISYACFRSAFTSKSNSVEITNGCLQRLLCSIIGAILGVMATTTWIIFFPPVISPHADGLNRYGGQIGLILLGVLIGGLIGAFITVREK